MDYYAKYKKYKYKYTILQNTILQNTILQKGGSVSQKKIVVDFNWLNNHQYGEKYKEYNEHTPIVNITQLSVFKKNDNGVYMSCPRFCSLPTPSTQNIDKYFVEPNITGSKVSNILDQYTILLKKKDTTISKPINTTKQLKDILPKIDEIYKEYTKIKEKLKARFNEKYDYSPFLKYVYDTMYGMANGMYGMLDGICNILHTILCNMYFIKLGKDIDTFEIVYCKKENKKETIKIIPLFIKETITENEIKWKLNGKWKRPYVEANTINIIKSIEQIVMENNLSHIFNKELSDTVYTGAMSVQFQLIDKGEIEKPRYSTTTLGFKKRNLVCK